MQRYQSHDSNNSVLGSQGGKIQENEHFCKEKTLHTSKKYRSLFSV